MVHAYNCNICKGDIGEPEVKGRLELYNKFKASPGYPVSNIHDKIYTKHVNLFKANDARKYVIL